MPAPDSAGMGDNAGTQDRDIAVRDKLDKSTWDIV